MRLVERVYEDIWGLQDVSTKPICEENKRTELAKSPLIVRALDLPLFWVGVQALVTSRAISILCEPPALRHASEVVLVEKLTRVPFLTKASEPVLTYGGKSLPVSRMSR